MNLNIQKVDLNTLLKLNAPFPELSSGILHVWSIKFNELLPYTPRLEPLLSPDEFDRISAYTRKEPYQNYVLSRGILRILLGSYLHLPPQSIRMAYSRYGKPEISPSQNTENIHFNISHANNCLLIAVGKKYRMGIDVEYIKKIIDYGVIAEELFTEEEYQMLSPLSFQEQKKAFFEIWTRKEALIKCMGEGLTYPLHTLNVINPGILFVKGSVYQLIPLPAEMDYQASLVYEGISSYYQIYYHSCSNIIQ